MINEIKISLENAVTNLLANQPDLFGFSSETRQSEWNITRHLANEICRLFPNYDCDVDVIKPSQERKRPDIILHKRGVNKSNFLVIEVKRDKRYVRSALAKIRDYWFVGNLRYQFGAVIVLSDKEEALVTVIKRDSSGEYLKPA